MQEYTMVKTCIVTFLSNTGAIEKVEFNWTTRDQLDQAIQAYSTANGVRAIARKAKS